MNENYVRIGGGLTRDPAVIQTRTGTPMVGLTVAVNGTRYDGETRQQVVTTEYVSVVAFGVVAEHVSGLGLGRGDAVVVEGRLSQEVIETPDGGKDRKTRVEAWNLIVTRQSSRVHVGSSPPPPPGHDPWGGGGPAYDEPPF